MDEEVNRDNNGEADGMNLEIDSEDEVMNVRSVIFKEEMIGGRERVATDEERLVVTARRLKRDKVLKIARLSSCKNFVSERQKFIFDAFVDL